jgi:hypothetical protein
MGRHRAGGGFPIWWVLLALAVAALGIYLLGAR